MTPPTQDHVEKEIEIEIENENEVELEMRAQFGFESFPLWMLEWFNNC